MDKTIDIFVNGSYLRKNHNRAGVQGEGNATIMHITFDEGWSEAAKSITFWNSRGENPVVRTLTADLLVDLTESLLEYNVPIPSEPMAYEGYLTFVIDGFIDGKRMRSIQDTLLVDAALIDDNAGEPVDPTPTQAEQLQEQMEGVLTVVQVESKIAVDAANKAKEHAEDAVETYNLVVEKAKEAEGYISEAEGYVEEASGYAEEASGYVELAAQQVALAEEKVIEAATYATDAEGFADDAKRYRDEAAESVGGDFVTNTAFNTAIAGINNAMKQLGTGDMEASMYDPQGKQTDVFKYVDDAVDGITAEDVGARPDTWIPTAADVGAQRQLGWLEATDLLEWASAQTSSAVFALNQSVTTVNVPFASWWTGELIRSSTGSAIRLVCLAGSSNKGKIYENYTVSGVWQSWRELLTTEGGTVDGGLGASGGHVYMNGDSNSQTIWLRQDNNLTNAAFIVRYANELDARSLMYGFYKNGAFAGQYALYGEHNITCGTSALTSNSSALATGCIYQQYK